MQKYKICELSVARQRELVETFIADPTSLSRTSDQFNVSSDTARTILRNHGYEPKEVKHAYWLNKAKLAAEAYATGMSKKSVEAQYNICMDTVYNYMNANGISYRSEHGRKNFFDQSFFHSIDTEASAYFLGFLFADGSISGIGKNYQRPCNISITISQKDRIILEQFLDAIQARGNTHIRDFQDSPKSYAASMMSCVNLTSTTMADDLIALGFSGLKSSRTAVPDISKEMLPHFVRGYFDGDGCITGTTLQFTGYCAFLENLMTVLNTELALPIKVIKQYYSNKSVGDLYYSKRDQLVSLFSYMYTDSTYYLPRKRDRFQELLK